MYFKSKAQIRKQILAFRDELGYGERVQFEKKIKKNLEIFLQQNTKSGANIAIYYPIGSEIDIVEITKNMPYNFLLPVVEKDTSILKFYPWKPGDKLIYCSYFKKILEPEVKIQAIIPDVIIAPSVACDLKGNRVGYGRGIYDKTVQCLRLKGFKFIYVSVVYKCQIVTNIISEITDQKLEKIFFNE